MLGAGDAPAHGHEPRRRVGERLEDAQVRGHPRADRVQPPALALVGRPVPQRRIVRTPPVPARCARRLPPEPRYRRTGAQIRRRVRRIAAADVVAGDHPAQAVAAIQQIGQAVAQRIRIGAGHVGEPGQGRAEALEARLRRLQIRVQGDADRRVGVALWRAQARQRQRRDCDAAEPAAAQQRTPRARHAQAMLRPAARA